MEIDAVSQSTGADRVVEVGPAEAGVLVVVRDRAGDAELGRAVVPADPLMTVLTDRPEGPQAVGELTVEVRRNEVLLALPGGDAAVGLDDLMDAVASALPS